MSIKMESADSSSSGSKQPLLPPGFRFHPTDEELVVHYLKKKAASAPLPVAIIADVDLYKFDPWELPAKAAFGEEEWYFFSPRDRKYPNGARPNRAATSGYWKATGTDKPVLTSGGTQKVGVKKALVFYGGKPPKGAKTNWIMHEYRLVDSKTMSSKPPGFDPSNKKTSLRLDDWVLCRIYKKHNMPRPMDSDGCGGGGSDHHPMTGMLASIPPSISLGITRPTIGPFNAMFENHDVVFTDTTLNSNVENVNSVNMTSSNLLPVKRSFWNELEAAHSGNSPSYTKRFLADSIGDGGGVMVTRSADENGGSVAGLLGQQQAMFGDGVYRQPYQLPAMNWYS
ncbi:hypothetical protein SSX86_032576 [Deinandra increscens subsp. villosa]|uniref:NAC domain-containing protein n=1 Tax=Deinandra increscens subsp. villosa TaxID=3103831 RepID=A0AAP0C3H1_9ASTR